MFFSMVDGRKKVHHDLMNSMAGNFQGVLSVIIPYLSVIEKMGIYREPVAAFSPRSAATRAYGDLWHKLEKILFFNS